MRNNCCGLIGLSSIKCFIVFSFWCDLCCCCCHLLMLFWHRKLTTCLFVTAYMMPNVIQKNGNHISFLPSTMILKCSERTYVTYTSEISPDPCSKKHCRVFVEQCRGLFLAELGLFFHFVSGLLVFSRSVPSLLLSLG